MGHGEKLYFLNFWLYRMKFLIEVVDLVTKCVVNAKEGKDDTVLSHLT